MPRAAWRGSWRRTTVCWTMSSSPERPTPSNFTAAALGPACAHGEARYRKLWPKVNGGLTTGACWPHGGSPGWQLTSLHTGLSAGGLRGTGRGGCTWRLNIGPPMGGRKWTGATRQKRTEPHGQFTGTDDFIARCYLNCDPRGRHQCRQHTMILLVMARRNWTVYRSSRINLSGPHQAV